MAKFGEAIEQSLDDLEGWGDGYTLQVKEARRELETMRELIAAAKLTQLMFRRSDMSGNFLGDDEHESWNAINKALTACQPRNGQ